jgi:hypothetical protein
MTEEEYTGELLARRDPAPCVNGLVASTDDDRVEALGLLVQDADLRTWIGGPTHRTVEDNYA